MSELADFIGRGRAWHTQVMTDTVTVTRPGPRVYDDAAQQYVETPVTVYTGQARIKAWRGTDEQAAETEVNVQRYFADFPLAGAVPNLARSDTLTVTASLNPVFVGRVLVLTEVETETTDTALRCVAEYRQ